jgi:hypothetical protein
MKRKQKSGASSCSLSKQAHIIALSRRSLCVELSPARGNAKPRRNLSRRTRRTTPRSNPCRQRKSSPLIVNGLNTCEIVSYTVRCLHCSYAAADLTVLSGLSSDPSRSDKTEYGTSAKVSPYSMRDCFHHQLGLRWR